jgi:hypothetical protein
MRTGIVPRFALIGALALVTGGLKCAVGPLDVGTGPVSTSIAGTWQGPIQDLTMSLAISDNDGTITGTGTMTQNGAPFALTVSGTNNKGSFSLQVSEVQHEPFTFTGALQNTSPKTLVGVANGSGLTNEAVTLTKQ